MGRPRSCECGECRGCKHREYMRGWYQCKSMDERREWIAKRDPERVRANDKARYERDKAKRLALNRKWRDENPERAKKIRKEWERRNPERVSELKRQWNERNPEKRAAHTAVGNAVRDGRLFPQPCEVCGVAKAEAHHDDYSKPLDVRWLCNEHHVAHHVAARAEAKAA